MESKIKFFNIFLAIILFVSLDQISKYIVRHGGGFYICNPNVAFGIPISPLVFWIFWLVSIIFLIYALFKPLITNNQDISNKQDSNSKYQIQGLALVLILAGASANVIDRFAFGCVIDFIDLKIWPAFNLADVFISLGAGILLVKWKKIC